MAPLRLIILAFLLVALIVGGGSKPVSFPRRRAHCRSGYKWIPHVGCRKILMVNNYYENYSESIHGIHDLRLVTVSFEYENSTQFLGRDNYVYSK